LPRRRLFNVYGPTEAAVTATVHACEAADADQSSVPIGKPIANVRIYVLDSHRRPVPLGAVGEIYIGGVGVARGYLNRPALTAERFIDSPFVPGERLYKTGDLARYQPDGKLLFLDRIDGQLKIRGHRVELGEIEARLAEYPGVREAIVVAREDLSGANRLVAYIVETAEAAAYEPNERTTQLREHLAARLPDYMMPVAYVRLQALPLTANGKVDRKALPVPEDAAYARSTYEAPTGEIEETLATIWAELLGVEKISRHDNFFRLGGHSLLAIRVTTRIHEECGVDFTLQRLFDDPTIAGTAHWIQRARDLARRISDLPRALPSDAYEEGSL
jgi:hypothetical protein